MIITIWCIAVVVISIVAVGVPLRWLLNGREPLGQQEWIEAPFLGIAAIVLILQNLVYLDLPLRSTSVLVWVLAGAGWIWMWRTGQLGVLFATVPKALFATALGVYLIHGLGLLIVGAKFYLGRAWGDQYNYTVLAQFLADERFSTSMQEVGNRPYLVSALRLKSDRIGQSVLHGFFSVSSMQYPKTLFEPMILLSPMLITLSIYALARRFGIRQHLAVLVAATAGLLPGIASVHLESFLSQALAMPLLLLMPVLLDRLIEQPHWGHLATCALLSAAITSIYTEFWAILLGLMVITTLVGALRTPHIWRLLAACGILALAPFALNPFFAGGILYIFLRIDKPVLGELYVWALTIEGFARLWLGDLAATKQDPIQSAIRAYTLACTGLAYYGLISRCLEWISTRRGVWMELERRRNLAFSLGVLALALLPVIVIARDNQHPYQYYKLLLSICPLFVLGLALTFLPSKTGELESPATSTPLPTRLAFLAIGTTLLGSMAGTTAMVVQSTSLQSSERYNGYFLIAPEMRQVQEYLDTLRNNNIFFYQPDANGGYGFLNGWFTYFARHNHIWLGNPHLNDVNLEIVPQAKQIIEASTIPNDALVLSSIDSQLASFLSDRTLLWSNVTYQVWKPNSSYWVQPLKFENKNGIEQLADKSFFWMGQGDTVLEAFASKSGTLYLNAMFLIGPSKPEQPSRSILLTTDLGYKHVITLTGSDRSLLLPVQAGKNTIRLRVLDRPTILQQPNGDARPLLLGVQALTMRLSETPFVIDRIDNPNGLETLGEQPFFWVGQGDTNIRVVASESGRLRLTATFAVGPSAPDSPTRRVLVATDRGKEQTFIVGNGLQSIVVPIEAGTTTITLRCLDQPSVASPLNGDPRPLLLGVQGLQGALEK